VQIPRPVAAAGGVWYHHHMNLNEVIRRLTAHRARLQELQVQALYVFGSVARGTNTPASDLDLMVEFMPEAPVGLFEFARIQRELSELTGMPVDLVTRDALHPLIRDGVLREAVHAA